MVQISNQLTLGKSEEHIIESLKGMTKEIINKEKQTRMPWFRKQNGAGG